MATSLHVKAKAPWKTVDIPQDLLNTEEFDGLVDIQELSHYELVTVKDEGKAKSRKRGGRKKQLPEHDDSREKQILDPIDSLSAGDAVVRKKGKKRKLENHGLNSNILKTNEVTAVKQDSNGENSYRSSGESLQKTSETEPPKKKQRKIKGSSPATPDRCTNGAIVNSENAFVVSDMEDSEKTMGDTAAENLEEKEKKPKKEKKRKKRKKKAQKSLCAISGSETSTPKDDDALPSEVKEISAEPASNMSQWENLYVPDILLRALQDQKFENPTEIQMLMLPSAIRDRKDILGAAETGSGKTLAFGIPVLAKILSFVDQEKAMNKDCNVNNNDADYDMSEDVKSPQTEEGQEKDSPPLALILEPTRELAVQVKKHLAALAKYTNIKCATVVGGMSVDKQRRILRQRPQIIIATPGRLWQLIEEGNSHLSQVDLVHCLVVDEADRMVEKGHYEELTKLFEMINKSPRRVLKRQTFVMSATLTMNVNAPKRLLNKMKKKNIDEDKLQMLTQKICVGIKPKVIDLTPKDKVSQTLTELRINCKAIEKDFYLYYFLSQHPGRTLVFANSKDCLRRLISVLTLLQCSPLPLHADMHQRQRLKNLDRFAENSKGLLVASDVAARGLDIPKVDHVIHYQVPRTMENYVHRSGRTARASLLGLSVMLVGPEDVRDYRKIVHGVRDGEDLPPMPVDIDLLPAVKMRVEMARTIDVKEHRLKKKKLRNNFFTKAAEEMDMIVDDRNLLEDLGDTTEQAQDKHQLKTMKAQLSSMLRGSLAPLRMSKYPTKSGQLEAKRTMKLYGGD